MTSGMLHDLFLSTLVKQAGGNRRRWRLVIGEIRLYDPKTHPHCNWAVTPTGSAGENDTIERIADDLRLRYPIVRAG
jgi:hypothetical protein